MANFAVIHGNRVINVIVADSLEVAESVTGYQCIENSDPENILGIGDLVE